MFIIVDNYASWSDCAKRFGIRKMMSMSKISPLKICCAMREIHLHKTLRKIVQLHENRFEYFLRCNQWSKLSQQYKHTLMPGLKCWGKTLLAKMSICMILLDNMITHTYAQSLRQDTSRCNNNDVVHKNYFILSKFLKIRTTFSGSSHHKNY